MFKKALYWLERSWWGILICYLVLVAFYYGVIWVVIEPAGIPDTFKEPLVALTWRVFYHIVLAVLLASHTTIVLDLIVRCRTWSAKNQIHHTPNRVVHCRLDYSLIEWHTQGGWRADTSHDPPDLRVTNSDKGGILRKTMSWTDYEFEFETRIEQVNTSWIVRAYDLSNYVMLQCWPDKIIPHYRRDDLWWREEERALSVALPRNDWFRVCIRVKEDEATAYVLEDEEKKWLFNDKLLGPRTLSLIPCQPTQSNPNYAKEEVFVSYLRGGVGFRAGSNECAYFRNIVVRQIGDDE